MLMSNKMKLSLTIFSVTATFFATGLTACGNSKWHEVARHTGDPVAEQQTTDTKARDLRPGQPVTTAPERVIVQKDAEQPSEEDIVLDRNEPVIVLDPTPVGKDGSVKVITVDDKEGYVPPQYLETKPVELKPEDKFFMIQNIATEKVRVYRNCATKDADGTCHHQMILETDMTAGEDTPDKTRRSILGSYTIEKWIKFYEDGEKAFPSWYDPKYPMPPKAGADITDWMTNKKYLPNGKGSMRGSFGWYTAYVGPDASEQWTHGTFGWGADGGKFIDASKDTKMDLRSRGCTRVENQAIAFMREYMPIRSKIFKVYAKEAVKDETLARYQKAGQKWSWILTKDGVRSTTATSGAKQNASKEEDEILEKGSYSLDQKPKVAKGNVYKIKAESFKGVFNIDEGRLVGYEHPKEIRVQGQKPYKLSSLVTSAK
jgi:hypothetical protein